MKEIFKIASCLFLIVTFGFVVKICLNLTKCNWATFQCVEEVRFESIRTETAFLIMFSLIPLILALICLSVFVFLRRKEKIKLK